MEKNIAHLSRNKFPANYRSSSKKHFKFSGNFKPILGNEKVVSLWRKRFFFNLNFSFFLASCFFCLLLLLASCVFFGAAPSVSFCFCACCLPLAFLFHVLLPVTNPASLLQLAFFLCIFLSFPRLPLASFSFLQLGSYNLRSSCISLSLSLSGICFSCLLLLVLALVACFFSLIILFCFYFCFCPCCL